MTLQLVSIIIGYQCDQQMQIAQQCNALTLIETLQSIPLSETRNNKSHKTNSKSRE